MKDFAKSIRTLNAKDKNGKEIKVGDIVRVKTGDPSLTVGTVERVSGEQIAVDMQGEGTWTTPARLAEKVSNKKVVNKTVMDDKGKFILGYVEKEGDKYVAYTHGITGAKTQLLKADDEKTATEELKDYCRTYWNKVGNSKVGNGLKEELKKRHKDSMIDDIKPSATLEAVKKEPWKVYDIIGVGDSMLREYVFDLVEEKYGIDYNDVYEAWLGHSWDKAVQKKSFDEAKKLAQKLGLRFGNSKACNAYSWREKNGHQELYNPNVPFGGHTRGYVEKGKNGYVGAKTNGSIVISKKEFATEEEAKKYVENKKVGNYGYIGQYSKTQTEKKFDDLLADIAELADMASEYAFMSEQIQNAKSVLNDIVSRANQAKSLADKISEEWKKTGGRK